MFCKHCGAELEQDQSICPCCGEPIEKEVIPEKKRSNVLKITLSVIACVLLVAMLAAIVFVGAGGQWSDIVKLFKKKENDIFYKDSYTVSDKKTEKTASVVVATAGEHTLTNSQLQVFYWMQVYDFIDLTGGYTSYYGLDLSKPLDEQIYNQDTGKTWQQYFLENALQAWHHYIALEAMAGEAGFTLPEDYQKQIANLETDMAGNVAAGGFESLDAMLRSDMGEGITVEDYRYYLTKYYLGNLYFTELTGKLEATQSEIEAWFAENEDELASTYGLTKEIGNLTDVRHLLVGIAQEGDDEEKEYTEAEWEACKQEAQALLDQWLAGEKTDASFAALVAEKTDDTASASSGGLYTYVYKSGQYMEEFEAWCADASRKAEDYGLVKTDYGYHIMYCVESEAAWLRYSRDCLLKEKAEALWESLDDNCAVEIDYKKIAIASISLRTA